MFNFGRKQGQVATCPYKKYIPIGDQYKDRFQEFLDKNFL
jgi:hypothetical protein